MVIMAHKPHSAGIVLVKIRVQLRVVRQSEREIFQTPLALTEMPTDPAARRAAADLNGRHYKGTS